MSTPRSAAAARPAGGEGAPQPRSLEAVLQAGHARHGHQTQPVATDLLEAFLGLFGNGDTPSAEEAPGATPLVEDAPGETPSAEDAPGEDGVLTPPSWTNDRDGKVKTPQERAEEASKFKRAVVVSESFKQYEASLRALPRANYGGAFAILTDFSAVTADDYKALKKQVERVGQVLGPFQETVWAASITAGKFRDVLSFPRDHPSLDKARASLVAKVEAILKPMQLSIGATGEYIRSLFVRARDEYLDPSLRTNDKREALRTAYYRYGYYYLAELTKRRLLSIKDWVATGGHTPLKRITNPFEPTPDGEIPEYLNFELLARPR